MKEDSVYIAHMLDAVEDVKEITAGMDEKSFTKNKAVKLATIKCIEIIGEAGKSISNDFRKRHPRVPWSDIIKIRDKTVHFYFGINYGLVWEVVRKNIPELEKELREIMLEHSGLDTRKK